MLEELPRKATSDESRRHRKMRKRVIASGALLALLVFLLTAFSSDFIPSSSMEPTLEPGDQILTMRAWIAYPFGAMPSRGDVITFRLSNERLNEADAYADDPEGSPPPVDHTAVKGKARAKGSVILIKRVVGLPGDRVQVRDNKVFVNGQQLHEEYQVTPATSPNFGFTYAVSEPLTVPKGELFLLGDNRNNSDDGRYWGTLKRGEVLGKFCRKLFHRNVDDSKKPGAADSGS